MTEQMRQVLELAAREEIRRVFDTEHGQPAWPVAHQTLNALERRGFLSRSERLSRHKQRVQVWEITEEGRAALLPPERYVAERDVYLGQVGCELGDDVDDELREKGYTTNPRRRIDHLPVAGLASTVWQRKSAEKKVAATDRRQRARLAAEKARYAA